jgi:hypothetical protein
MKTKQLYRARWGLLLALAIWGGPAQGGDLPLEEVVRLQPFLREQRPTYANYALAHYENYPNHTFPYRDVPKARYDPMGNHLVTGYDLYRWEELRTGGGYSLAALFLRTPDRTI